METLLKYMGLPDVLELVISLPFIMLFTAYLKTVIPDRHHALIPLTLGPTLIVLSHLAGSQTSVTEVLRALLEGMGAGGIASSIRDYHHDNKDLVDKLKSFFVQSPPQGPQPPQ